MLLVQRLPSGPYLNYSPLPAGPCLNCSSCLLTTLIPQSFPIPQETGEFKCLPYFQILGVSKCGTTDLYHRLTFNPNMVDCGWKVRQYNSTQPEVRRYSSTQSGAPGATNLMLSQQCDSVWWGGGVRPLARMYVL